VARFFLHLVLSEFAPLCAARGDHARAERYRSEGLPPGEHARADVDGDGTCAATTTMARRLGSAQNAECSIDSIAQSWAVLSAAVPTRFADRAMDAVRSHLVQRGSQTLLLLAPPFDQSFQDPGYIKGYPRACARTGGSTRTPPRGW